MNTWTTLDPSKKADEEKIEIVVQEEEEEKKPEAITPVVEAKQEDVEEGTVEAGDEEETDKAKKPTRSQRLKFQRDRERTAREAAEAKATTLEAEVAQLRKERQDNLKVGAEKLGKTLDELVAAQEKTFADALANNDHEAAAKAQRRITELIADKVRIPEVVEEAKPAERTVQQAPQQEKKFSQEAIAWAQRNKAWFGKDRVATAAAYAIDSELTEEGHDPNDPEYYEELEKRLKEELPHKFEVKERQAKPNPVSRGGSGKDQVRKVNVTQDELRRAAKLGLTPEQYVRQKENIEKNQNTLTGYTQIL